MSLFRLIAGSSENQGISFISLWKLSLLFFFASANITDNWIRLWLEQKIKTSVLEKTSYIRLLNININKGITLFFSFGEISACCTKAWIQVKEGLFIGRKWIVHKREESGGSLNCFGGVSASLCGHVEGQAVWCFWSGVGLCEYFCQWNMSKGDKRQILGC